MKACTGKVLFINLTRRTWREETPPEEMYEHYLSGVGLAAALLTPRIPAGADPLGPDNVLGFVAGLLTGTGALFSGRWLVTGKSPLTGGWGDANCGGNFGPAIKGCGYDGIFIQGAASEPVYVYADGKTVEIRSAAHLWGKDSTETEAILIAESGDPRRARVACIGPSGEKLSLISGICNDRGRLAARSGLGAVMGSKKLKAVLLEGRMPVPCADPAEVKRLSKAVSAYVPRGDMKVPSWIFPIAKRFMTMGGRASRLDGVVSLPPLRTWGTGSGNTVCVDNGDAPVKNWTGSRADYAAGAIDADRFRRRTLKKYHCYACPLGCGGICKAEPPHAETHRPEFETTIGLGPLLLNQDLNSIFALNETLNRAGMDTISAAATVAFAIECFQNGLLSERETGGLKLSWGDSQAILRLVDMMIERQGVGDLLADGVKAAAQRIGRGSERFAMHAGGQELPMHDPKQDPAYGVHYIAEPTPGRHTVGSGLIYEMLRLWRKVGWVPEMPASYTISSRYSADEAMGFQAAGAGVVKMLIDCAGLCNFGLQMGVDRFQLFEVLNAATGLGKTPEEYMEIGLRIQTLRQLFNLRQGVDPAQVRLPGQADGHPPLDRGPLKGKQFDVYAMRQAYWQALGWDPQTGVPLPETLERLALSELTYLSAPRT